MMGMGGGGPPDDGDDASSSDEEERKRRKDARRAKRLAKEAALAAAGVSSHLALKVKESESVKIGIWPTVLQFPAWRRQVRQEMVAAAGRPKEETVPWILQVESPATTFESLEKVMPEWSSLDSKLGSAVIKIAKGEPGRRIGQVCEEAAALGSLPSGRQLLWLVYKEFGLDLEKSQHHGIQDIMSLRCDSIKNLEGFLTSWDAVVLHMSGKLPPFLLCSVLHKQLKKLHELNDDIRHFDRQDEGHPDRSYDFLLRIARRYIERSRTERQRLEIADVYAGKVPTTATAMAALRQKEEKKNQQLTAALPAGAVAVPGQCNYFAKTGSCKYGDKCKYAHDKHIGSTPPPSPRGRPDGKGKGKGKGKAGRSRTPSPSGDKKLLPCRFFARGDCHHGDECHYSHAKVVLGTPCILAAIANIDKDCRKYAQFSEKAEVKTFKVGDDK